MSPTDDVRARRLEQELARAVNLLEQRKGYAAAMVEIHDRNGGVDIDQKEHGTPDMLRCCCELFDIGAEVHLRLVSDLPSRKAYEVVSRSALRRLWELYTGFSFAAAPPDTNAEAANQLEARFWHWSNEADRQLAVLQAAQADSIAPAGARLSIAASERPPLDTARINRWIDDNGYVNKTLAEEMKISERVISSLRNNGAYHGIDAITKLANLMGCDAPSDLYLD